MGDLAKGCITIISIAIATGHYGDLQEWARKEASRPMTPLPYLFKVDASTLHSRSVLNSRRVKTRIHQDGR